MKGIVFLSAMAYAQASTVGLQQMVDSVFEKYLPSKHEGPCPFVRISEQCGLFNSTMAEIKACHQACSRGDFECHMRCPKAKPTSVGELQKLAEAMLCHKACGTDLACHRDSCSCPFEQKHAACSKLAEVVECHKKGGSHETCKLDEDAKELLLHEPWSLVQDVAHHVVDYVLPADKVATCKEVHDCHARCGRDQACHKACPQGAFGVLKEQCAVLDEAKACHESCKAQEVKCPFKKFTCHMKCPMSMPSSVEELKGAASHMACHAECGADKQCHKLCPMPRGWAEKKERCEEYDKVAACHRGCKGLGHPCHFHCPSLDLSATANKSTTINGLVKQAVSQLII